MAGLSLSKNLVEFAARTPRKEFNLFFAAACTWQKTLLGPQTCELSGAPTEAQRSGFGGERSRSGANELSLKAEANDTELTATKCAAAGRSLFEKVAKPLFRHAQPHFFGNEVFACLCGSRDYPCPAGAGRIRAYAERITAPGSRLTRTCSPALFCLLGHAAFFTDFYRLRAFTKFISIWATWARVALSPAPRISLP